MACAIETNNNTSALKYPLEEAVMAGGKETSMCIVCWEPANEKATTILSCQHGACTSCIVSWIERCEKEGHDEATCPHCRQSIPCDTIRDVLGRSYKRVSKTSANEEPVDDFTQTWFQENAAHQCLNCGMWMVREEEDDEDDMLPAAACVCGFIHCWTCKAPARGCRCNHYEFHDELTNLTLDMKDAEEYPVAGPEHFDDLTDFMEERKTAVYARQVELRQQKQKEKEEQAKQKAAIEEPSEVYWIPLFDEYTEDMNVCVVALFEEYTEEAREVFVPLFA